MRTLRLLRARQDMIELLLRRGRLGDMQMMHFYNTLVERELDGEKAPTGSHSSTSPATPIAGLHMRKERVQELARHGSPLAWLGEVYGTTQWSTSYLASRTVHARDATDGQSSTAKESAAAAVTHGEAGTLYLTGHALAAGEVGRMPSSVQIIAAHVDGTEEEERASMVGSQVVVSVSLQQPAVKTTVLSNGLLRIDLDNAVSARVWTETAASTRENEHGVDATRDETSTDSAASTGSGSASSVVAGEKRTSTKRSVQASQVAAHQHVLTAAAYGAIVGKLEEVCALHATTASRYDALLIRNPATQMRLSQLACARYGIESLLSYVMQASAMSETDTSTKTTTTRASHAAHTREGVADEESYVPLIESAVLNMYAEGALMESLDGAWAMLHGTPLHTAQPHRSQPVKIIDYPYVEKLMNTSKYVLTAVDGAMELQALQYLMPILHDTHSSTTKTPGGSLAPNAALEHGGSRSSSSRKNVTASSSSSWTSMMYSMLSMTRGEIRLAMPHVNLRHTITSVEQDVSKLLQLVNDQKYAHDPCFAIAVGQFVAELFASVAVVCRCTAALNMDEGGKGHREWLLAQSFLSISAARRVKIMADYENMRAARAVLRHTSDMDNYTTHPVQLMNAAHVKKMTATDAAKTRKEM